MPLKVGHQATDDAPVVRSADQQGIVVIECDPIDAFREGAPARSSVIAGFAERERRCEPGNYARELQLAKLSVASRQLGKYFVIEKNRLAFGVNDQVGHRAGS